MAARKVSENKKKQKAAFGQRGKAGRIEAERGETGSGRLTRKGKQNSCLAAYVGREETQKRGRTETTSGGQKLQAFSLSVKSF